MEGPVSSVMVRLLSPDAPPARNSLTKPPTETSSPILTLGADDVNTKMPSDVASSASVPSSKKFCDAAPPMAVKVQVTTSPVLVGTVPGVTLTVSSVPPPCGTTLGFAAPTPLGFVEPPQTLNGEAVLRGVGVPALK